MKRFFVLTLMVVFFAGFAVAGPLDVKELKLKNGLTVWLNEDHSQPKVWGAVVVKAGAVDTPNEGIAHYFEHIMFKGTDQIGTVDYAKEKPLLDSISLCYDRLAQTDNDSLRTEIQKEINRLSIAAADYAIPNEFDRLINLFGGSGLNAGTGDDMTYYYNTFSPQYMPQWLELNSHRLLNPVFRLFQSELESVYEEKNMYSDDIMSSAVEEIRGKWFGDTPYAYPIIGSTENLKNPQMSKMREFYKTYYVANNMALILTGDFKIKDVVPLLEGTFGRIPAGAPVPERADASAPKHSGETVDLKIPVPIINAFALIFDYPKSGHEDSPAMEVAMELLTNESQTGLLDQIMTDKKALATMGSSAQLNGAGFSFVLAVPKIFSSSKKLESLIWQKFDTLTSGDIPEQTFEAVKNSLIDSYYRSLESIGSRGRLMISTWVDGETWKDYLTYVDKLQEVTIDDVMAVSKKYFNRENFMRVVKKFGNQTHDKLSQPGYRPVKPKNGHAESAYAKKLQRTVKTSDFTPRLVDLKNDAKKTNLAEFTNLYTVENPFDSLFHLNIIYYSGDCPMDSPLASLLSEIGTQDKTRQEFNDALLQARASIDVDKEDSFGMVFTLKGHDSKFHEALALLSEYINSPKADRKSMSNVIDGLRVEEKAFNKQNTSVRDMLFEWFYYGDKSTYLTRATKKAVKKMKPEQLLAHLDYVKKAQMSVVYSGKLSSAEVEKAVREMLPIDTPEHAAVDPFTPFAANKAENVVYFYDMKKARQALVGTFSVLPAEPDAKGRELAFLWDNYFGGDMSSVMFRELREYRSLGYNCGSLVAHRSFVRHPNEPGKLIMYIGTQADKMMDAFEALDTIVQNIPVSESIFEAMKISRLNRISHSFPTFYYIGSGISHYDVQGETEDPDARTVRCLPGITMQDVVEFHEKTIKPAPHAYYVIADKKAVDMEALARLGEIVMVTDKQIYKKK